MKRRSLFVLTMALAIGFVFMSGMLQGEFKDVVRPLLEYKVVAVEANNWIITAEEMATGEMVKFRLPPQSFKGQTFEANLEQLKPGQGFSVKGPRNASLNNMVVEKPLPSIKNERRKNLPKGQFNSSPGSLLTWEITHVDPKNWIVTARNRYSKMKAKFKANPNGFIGFKFRALLRGINKGRGFSIMTPNDLPLANICTLLELRK
jgi:hypothetical protein